MGQARSRGWFRQRWDYDNPQARLKGRNPYSDGLMADYEEVTAVAMLLGEEHPILCSCCIGTGVQSSIFGGSRTCTQCKNTGYDWIGTQTHRYFVGRHRSRHE